MVSGTPGDGNGIRGVPSCEHPAPGCHFRIVRAKVPTEHDAAIDHPAGQARGVGGDRDRTQRHDLVITQSVGSRLKGQKTSIRVEPSEEHDPGAEQLGERGCEMSEEGGQLGTGFEVRLHRHLGREAALPCPRIPFPCHEPPSEKASGRAPDDITHPLPAGGPEPSGAPRNRPLAVWGRILNSSVSYNLLAGR